MADKRISQLVERTDIANNDVLPIVASGATTTNKVTVSTLQEWMQDNLDVGVTSVGITLGTTGTDINVTGSPVTSSGNITINLPTASATNRGALSSADWSTFNSKQGAITLTTTGTSGASTLVGNTLNIPNYTTDLSGYVTLGTAQTITAQKTFSTSGSSDTMIISHGSGSGFALDVIKAGSGEAIRVQKTSGSGNAMTISGGNFEAPTIVKTGGTSSQFLKADGSVDSSTYLTTGTAASTYVPYTGATTSVNLGDNVLTSGGLNIDNLGGFGGALNLRQATGFSLWSGAPYTSIYATPGNNLIINFSNDGRTITLNGSLVSSSSPRTFTFPDATGTIALTSDIPTNPVGGTGTTNQIPKFTGSSTIGNSNLSDDGSAVTCSTELRVLGALNGTTASLTSTGTHLSLIRSTFNTFTFSVGTASGISGLLIGNNTAGTTPLIINQSGGAATFSSSVTATSFIVGNGQFYRATRSSGSLVTDMIGIPSGTDNVRVLSTGDINFVNGSLTNLLTIANSGAATFSSSVTATSFSNAGLQSGEVFNATKSNAGYFVGYFQNTSATGLGLYIQNGNDNNDALRIGNAAGTANNIQLYGSGKAYFAGNVGIGTASPNTKLQVEDGFISTYHPVNLNSAGYGIQFFTNGGGSKNTIASIDISQVGTARSGDIIFSTSNSGAPTERMRITSGGNVGIGTTSITNSISGTERILEIANSNVASLYLNSTVGKKYGIYSSASGSLVTYDITSSAARLILDTNGNFGLGYTSPNKFGVLEESTKPIRNYLGNANAQGRAQNYKIVRHIPVTSIGNVLTIPFTSQGNLNSNTIARISGHSARFNNWVPLGFVVEVAVGHLTSLGALQVMSMLGNASAVSISGMNLQISFGSTYQGSVSDGLYLTIEYMTNEVSYSIFVPGIALN